MVDYCAQPNECVELIKKCCDLVILGNHDEAQYNFSLVYDFTDAAAISSVHTRDIIKPEYTEYFKTLKYTYSENNLLFVHASPCYPERYNYCETIKEAEKNFKCFNEAICFIGHSHEPVIFEKKEYKVSFVKEGHLNQKYRYLINVGSVGQPRDKNPKLSFGIFDTNEFKYENVRLDYDIHSAAEKIIREGLPVKLAQRLFAGV